jgi:flagellar biosynthesis protein FlhG
MARMSFAVGGGKGGTGKSIVSCNLAIAMAQAGYRVILVDADLGAANVHTMFGIDRPRALLEQFVSRRAERLEDVLVPTGVRNLQLICGGMPLPGTANPNFSQKVRLIKHIDALDADVVISDIGAGVNFNVLDLFNAARIKLAVITAQLTAVHNGYGFLKAALHRHLLRSVGTAAREHLESAGPQAGDESLADMLSRLMARSPDDAAIAKAEIAAYRAYLVGNMIASPKDGLVISAVSQMIRDHLHIEAQVLGLLKQGDKLQRSVNERRPFMLSAGIEANAETFRKMAATLLRAASEAPPPKQERLIDEAIEDKAYERLHPRFPTRAKAAFTADGTRHDCRLRDVSEGGVGLLFATRMAIRIDGALEIGPLDDGRTISLRIVERHRDDGGFRIGCSFVELDEKARCAVAQLVAGSAAVSATGSFNRPPSDPPVPADAPRAPEAAAVAANTDCLASDFRDSGMTTCHGSCDRLPSSPRRSS